MHHFSSCTSVTPITLLPLPKHDSWPNGAGGMISVLAGVLSGLPCGISGQLHVSLMDLIAGLPELQALILLVRESVVSPVGLSALALRRQ